MEPGGVEPVWWFECLVMFGAGLGGLVVVQHQDKKENHRLQETKPWGSVAAMKIVGANITTMLVSHKLKTGSVARKKHRGEYGCGSNIG